MGEPAADHGSEQPQLTAVDVARRLRLWLASGGCQGDTGAFHAWRDEESGALAFEYPEITGYALTYLSGLEQPTDLELGAARAAADWLLERVVDRGDYSARSGWDDGAVYNFDLAMIATGLINAGALMNDDRCRQAGCEIVAYMADQVDDSGRVPAVAAAGAKSDRSGWSVDGEAHMLKALQCFALADQAGGKVPVGVLEGMAASFRDVQEVDGRFRTQAVDDRTMLHPHLYAVEGLWAYGQAYNDHDALESARRGAEWVWRQQLPTGGFPRLVAVDPSVTENAPEQFDLTAQALRAGCLFGLDPDGRSGAARRLAQISRPAPEGACALPYQPPPAATHLNAWVGMFAAQAMAASAGDAAVTWSNLV